MKAISVLCVLPGSMHYALWSRCREKLKIVWVGDYWVKSCGKKWWFRRKGSNSWCFAGTWSELMDRGLFVGSEDSFIGPWEWSLTRRFRECRTFSGDRFALLEIRGTGYSVVVYGLHGVAERQDFSTLDAAVAFVSWKASYLGIRAAWIAWTSC